MQMHDINRFFVDNPELKKYFGGNEPVPANHPDGERLECLAELIIDFADNFVTQAHMLEEDLRLGCHEYLVELYKRSPPMRAYWERHKTW